MSAEQHRGRSINDKRNWISHIVWNVSLYHINICLHIIVISRWYDGLSSHHGRWVTHTMLLNICVQFVAMHVTTFRLVFFCHRSLQATRFERVDAHKQHLTPCRIKFIIKQPHLVIPTINASFVWLVRLAACVYVRYFLFFRSSFQCVCAVCVTCS